MKKQSACIQMQGFHILATTLFISLGMLMGLKVEKLKVVKFKIEDLKFMF
jgi:hypothetical protein